jgi:phage/plasmid-associated DNA primase
MEERVEKKPGFVSTHDLHHDWFEWAKERGVDIGLSQGKFKKLMVKRGLVEGRRKAARGFEGLALKPKEPSPSESSNGQRKATEVGAGMPPEPPEWKSPYE